MKVELLAALSLAVAGACPVAAAPLETYGKLLFVEEVALSPDGGKLAYATTNGEQRRVLIQDTASQKIIESISAGDHKLRDIEWAGTNHLILTESFSRHVPEVDSPSGE